MEWKKVRPNSRQSIRGRLGRSSKAKTAQNSKMWRMDWRTDWPTWQCKNKNYLWFPWAGRANQACVVKQGASCVSIRKSIFDQIIDFRECKQNKAGYTANTSRGWVSRGGNACFPTFRLERHGPTNQPTDGPTDRRTDERTKPLIVACPRLKNEILIKMPALMNISGLVNTNAMMEDGEWVLKETNS